MKKIYNAVASEYEMPQLTPEPRYLKCEALTGEWWYKDMQTGENLPLFTQPINWVHNDTLTFNQEKVFNEFVENVIDPIEQCQELQKEVDKLKKENEFLKLNNPEMNIEHFRVIKENKRKINNLRAENKRLKNIINELENMISIKYIRATNEEDYDIETDDIKELLDRLKELKENK